VTEGDVLQKRLLFLSNIVEKELRHLSTTDERLFSKPLTLEKILQLENEVELSEKVETFASRFARLQDTVGAKLLPQLMELLQEKRGVMIDNLDWAEKQGWIENSDHWMEIRELRNKMVHEYIESEQEMLDALNKAHHYIPTLKSTVEQMLNEIKIRVGLVE